MTQTSKQTIMHGDGQGASRRRFRARGRACDAGETNAIGASNRRATPIPDGSRPSTAALMRLGARKASEIVIWTWRLLQASRVAMSSMVAEPASISDSQWRPRAIAVTSLARVSERTGRASACDEPSGTRTSRWRRYGVLLHGTVRTSESTVFSSESRSSLPSEIAISVRLTSMRWTQVVIFRCHHRGHRVRCAGGLRRQ
jgi:hypothetical protein